MAQRDDSRGYKPPVKPKPPTTQAFREADNKKLKPATTTAFRQAEKKANLPSWQTGIPDRFGDGTYDRNAALYEKWRDVQAKDKANPQPRTDPNLDPRNFNPENEVRRVKGNDAYTQRMNAQAGGGPQKPGEIFGVNYGPNWRRGEYVPDPSLRSGKLAGIQMTPQEYLLRREQWERMYQPGYNEWLAGARNSPNEPHDIYSQWRINNPRPGGFLQTEQERIVRQNAAPTGQTYVPFGSSYIDQPRQAPNKPPTTTTNPGGGGGGGGYGGRGYGGGGGGGGYGGGDYEQPANFWQQFLNWRVLEIQGG